MVWGGEASTIAAMAKDTNILAESLSRNTPGRESLSVAKSNERLLALDFDQAPARFGRNLP
jgi:hypothetical protein